MMFEMSKDVLEEFNVPYCIPLIYTFDENMEPLNYQFLGDQGDIVFKIDRIKGETIETQEI